MGVKIERISPGDGKHIHRLQNDRNFFETKKKKRNSFRFRSVESAVGQFHSNHKKKKCVY